MKNYQIEKQINQFLQTGLKTHLELKKQGRKELANAVLAYTSNTVDILLTLTEIRKGYRPVYCPTCCRKLTNGIEIEFTKQVGECPSCDHLRTDLYCQDLWDYASEEVGE